MKYNFLHIYWRPARYSYQMMFESLKRNTTGISFGAGTQLSLSRYLSLPLICSRIRVSWPLVFCMFWLSFCPFFGHCIVCPSSYGFCLTLWYPQTFYVKTILTLFLFFVCLFLFILFFFFCFVFSVFWLPLFCLSFQSSLVLIQ
jgi:hypothetical protein